MYATQAYFTSAGLVEQFAVRQGHPFSARSNTSRKTDQKLTAAHIK